jgi:DNA-binding GntR family transcriptional regulator
MESPLVALAEDAASGGHRTLAEKAFQTLHRAIITGRLSPGERLPIEDLAEIMYMSPMPIREALRRLDAAGLVENIPHRGARVTELSMADLAEVFEVRLSLEPMAVRRAAERFSPADEQLARRRLAQLNQICDGDSGAIAEAHEAFHFALYGAAGSAWLLRTIRPVWDTSERYCLALPESRQQESRIGEHSVILDACAARDPDRAATALHGHLATTANNVAIRMGHPPLYQITWRNRAERRGQRRRAP